MASILLPYRLADELIVVNFVRCSDGKDSTDMQSTPSFCVLSWQSANRLDTAMNRNDLRRVDMNLLVIFEALMFEKNLTRVAERLFMGQPAVSAALGRLRDLFDDPLLLRQRAGHGAHAARPGDTQGAATGYGHHFRRGQPRQGFRPVHQLCGVPYRPVRRRRIWLVSAVAQSASRRSPGIIVVVRRANYLLMSALLASGEISVGVSYTTELPANAKRKKLRDIRARYCVGMTGWRR